MTASQPLTVEFGPVDARTALRHRVALASVPQLLQEGRAADGIRFVDGGRAAWAAEVVSAVEAGVCGVLVSQPGCCPTEDLDKAVRAAVSSDVPVAVALRASGNRAFLAGAQRPAAQFGELAIFDAVHVVAPADVHGAALLGPLVDQIALLVRVAGAAGDLERVHSSGDGYVVTSDVGGCAVSLSATVSGAGDHGGRVDLVGIPTRWSMHFPDQGPARPAEIVEYTRDGGRQRELIFESAERTTWIALYDAVRGTSRLPLDFATFAEYHRTASVVLGVS